eukprot:CAMPEP_0185487256 /NCGR_PEP_ID=MMETSP1366-20130426/11476_1 /TAXON_ID=38817 /ORGANISM="Gephyrocapsa oceanica, Strain RCC1303" /LENGTH=133 /DNA_ID=CAMNT_0028095581 /DNA_START=157 /DNA_END=554 /DNA_ORIENTATION=+
MSLPSTAGMYTKFSSRAASAGSPARRSAAASAAAARKQPSSGCGEGWSGCGASSSRAKRRSGAPPEASAPPPWSRAERSALSSCRLPTACARSSARAAAQARRSQPEQGPSCRGARLATSRSSIAESKSPTAT